MIGLSVSFRVFRVFRGFNCRIQAEGSRRLQAAGTQPAAPWKNFRRSGEEVFHDVAVDVGEPEVAAGVAEGEAFVIEAEEMQ